MPDDPRWPVFGPHRTGGGNYMTLPRASLGAVADFFGWGRGRDERDLRLAYDGLWRVSSFHPSGCYAINPTEIGEFYGITERRVRAALGRMAELGAVVWDPRRSIVYVPDVPTHNFHTPVAQEGAQNGAKTCRNLVQNVQAHLSRLSECEPVARCRADLCLEGEGGESVVSSQLSVVSQKQKGRPASGQRAKGQPQATDSCSSGYFDFYDGAELPIPPGYSEQGIEEILGDLERMDEQIDLAVAVLLEAQRRVGRDTDHPPHVRKLASARDEPGRALLMRIEVRLDEAERTGETRWLNAPTCFGLDGGPAEQTQGLVWKRYGWGERPDSWRASQ